MRWITAIVAFGIVAPALAQGQYVGPKECGQCHKPEFAIWEKTTHALGFVKFHRQHREQIDKILKAVGSTARSIREEALCLNCHYTANPGARPVATVSCERCHGAAGPESGGWLRPHADYGAGVKERQKETPEHREQRIEQSASLGLIRSDMLYDIASNCMACHGLASPGVDRSTLAKMLEAGHPLKQEYELVKYSQGEVRHRFYPLGQPLGAENPKSPPDQLARLFVAGQLAKIVSAQRALEGAPKGRYRDEQLRRREDARTALKNVPGAASVISSPTDDKARAVFDQVRSQDLLSVVGRLLPPESEYIYSTKYR